MKIRKIDVENFGKFSNYSLLPGDGFNLIFGNNEDGKSTLMSFIKLMFFGNSSGRSSDILKNSRKKYSPWNGSPMSGAIEIQLGDENLRIHKDFKKTAASDKTEVFNLDNGDKISVDGSLDIGNTFLDMNLDEFERSVFIENFGGFSSEGSTDSLAMRIANLSVSGDEGTSSTEIISRLNAALLELSSKTQKKGLLVDAQNCAEQIRYDIDMLEAQAKAQHEFLENIDDLSREISELESKLEEIFKARKAKSAVKDLGLFKSLKKKLDTKAQLLTDLGAFGLTPESLPEFIFKCKEIKVKISNGYTAEQTLGEAKISDVEYGRIMEIASQLSAYNKDRELLSGTIQRSFKKHSDTALAQERKSVVISSMLAIFGIGSIILFPAKFYIGLIFIILGVLLLFLGLSGKASQNIKVQLARQELDNNLRLLSFYHPEMADKTLDDISRELDERLAKCNEAIESKLNYYGCATLEELGGKTVSAQNSKFAESVNLMNEHKLQFVSLVSQVSTASDYDGAISSYNQLKEIQSDLESTDREIDLLSGAADLEDISTEFAESKIIELEEFLKDGHFDEDMADIDEGPIKTELTQKRKALGDLQSRINVPETSREQLEVQLGEVNERINSLTHRKKALEIAQEVMEASVSNMNKGLGSLLSKKTGEYLGLMSGGAYTDVFVSRDLNVEVKNGESGKYFEWKYMSSGAIDRIYLALRLAATDIIAGEDNPLPLFLDDILTQYDDENCRNTLKFLKSYLEKTNSVSQIFFFTCHRHIADMAKEIIPDLSEITLQERR